METGNDDLLENIAEGEIYTTRTIIISSLFGGLFASSYMIYKNFKLFGENKKAGITILLTVLIFFGLMATGLSPALDKIPGIFYSILLTLATSLLTIKYQGHLIASHINREGKLRSGGNAVLVCIVSILIMVALMLGAFYLQDTAVGNI
jgi:hypothetical protein